MLDFKTFGPGGGNVLYKALAHPLTAEALAGVIAGLDRDGPFAIYDAEGASAVFAALYPDLSPSLGWFTHQIERVGERVGTEQLRPLSDLPPSCRVLVLSFEPARMAARLLPALPELSIVTLPRLPDEMLANPTRYLDPANFATNFAFFRDDDRFGTRLVTANYWSRYGARDMRLSARLYDGEGRLLVTWEEPVGEDGAGIVLDSAEIRARFDLPPFRGQLFLHAIGARGHDVVKYALDIRGRGAERSLSVTHDANAWPSDRYATLPAPREGEDIVLWVQNSHAAPILDGAMSLNRMGREESWPIRGEIAPFATRAVRLSEIAPHLAWPAQLEFRAGKHVVRPRYEVTQAGRTRIAHCNVEREGLLPDPGIRELPRAFGRGFLLPFPVLDPTRYSTVVQPTPMSERIASLPVRVDAFDAEGRPQGSRFLGDLPRDHACAFDLSEITQVPGHAELVYDFRDGGEADGWLHALIRYETADHAAETSFGAHIFNTLMTYRSEPQSYVGPPPGLSTRLFLKLGETGLRSYCVLIHPVSGEGRGPSDTHLALHDASGAVLVERAISIPPSGSFRVEPDVIFGADALTRAGNGGYVMIRDQACRLFGYHGQVDERGGFSLDHMFGF